MAPQQQEKDWKQLIIDADPKELKEFLLIYGGNNIAFREHVELTFSKPKFSDTEKTLSYQRLIRNIFDQYSDRGYIDYRRSWDVINDLIRYQVMANTFYAQSKLNEAFCLAAALVVEAGKAIQNMDDSSGGCGDGIMESIDLIKQVLDNSKAHQALKEDIFEWLYEQVQNDDYIDYGIDGLEPLFFHTAIALKKEKIALEFVEIKISAAKQKSGWSRDYNLQKYLGNKSELLKSAGKTAEADEIIDTNLEFDEFRQIRVDQAISAHQLKKAEERILEGIKIAEKEELYGVIHNWKDQLLELYKLQKATEKYHSLARQLFIENISDLKYFKIFKETTPKNTWEWKRGELLAELKHNSRGDYVLNPFASIYLMEDMIDELFELVSAIAPRDITALIRYTAYLNDAYPKELVLLYEKAIETEAEQTGRGVYIQLVEYLKKMSQLDGGLPAAIALKNSLLAQYNNRPAMREEFEKLNWG